jgi:hypothetical protein
VGFRLACQSLASGLVVVVAVLLQVDLLQVDLLLVDLLQMGPILPVDLLPVDLPQVGPILPVDLLQVGPIQGMRFLGILLRVVLFQVNFRLVLAGFLRVVCSGPIKIFGLTVLRLVGLVCLISLLGIELRRLWWSCVWFWG